MTASKVFAAIIIAGFILIYGIMVFPSINFSIMSLDTTGFLPLVRALIAGFPYLFLLAIIYYAYRKSRMQ